MVRVNLPLVVKEGEHHWLCAAPGDFGLNGPLPGLKLWLRHVNRHRRLIHSDDFAKILLPLSWTILTNLSEVSALLSIWSCDSNLGTPLNEPKVLVQDRKNSVSRCAIGRGKGFYANPAICFHIGGKSGDESGSAEGSSSS